MGVTTIRSLRWIIKEDCSLGTIDLLDIPEDRWHKHSTTIRPPESTHHHNRLRLVEMSGIEAPGEVLELHPLGQKDVIYTREKTSNKKKEPWMIKAVGTLSRVVDVLY